MLSFPNCKINIGLNITGKRADGFHNLETIFYPIAIKDAVEIVASANETTISFGSSGNAIEIKEEDNLCVKAYHLLKKDFPQIPNIKMHLHKNIPMGAGLGGGSADASAVLILLNTKFNLEIPQEKLLQYALMLGSDCPFFIFNKPCFASGRGEILSPIELDLSGYKIIIVNPDIHVNTGAAFGSLDANNFSKEGLLSQQIKNEITTWKDTIKNDFEIPVFKLHPEIATIKNKLYENGAIYSAMSGSGSSVFGIFSKEINLNVKFPTHYFCQMV
jgi:4-diphosphocytidyl-2-C-methyl-D-erythritol kinase